MFGVIRTAPIQPAVRSVKSEETTFSRDGVNIRRIFYSAALLKPHSLLEQRMVFFAP